jgi:hypothetical protein
VEHVRVEQARKREEAYKSRGQDKGRKDRGKGIKIEKMDVGSRVIAGRRRVKRKAEYEIEEEDITTPSSEIPAQSKNNAIAASDQPKGTNQRFVPKPRGSMMEKYGTFKKEEEG